MVPSHLNLLSCSLFRNELNLSSINPPSYRTKISIDVEIEDQNLYGLESSSDCISVGGTVKSSMLNQVRDQYCLIPN